MTKKPNSRGSCLFSFIFFLFLPVFFYHPLWSDNGTRLFKLSDFSGSINLQYQLTDEQESAADYVYRDSTRKFLEGGIFLVANGSIYHPNLLYFHVNLNIAGYRSSNTIFSDAAVNNAINNNYDVRVNFLRKKKITLEFYTRSDYRSHDRVFWERYYVTYKGTGVRLNSHLEFMPIELHLYTNRLKSESLTYLERDEKSQHIDLRLTPLPKSRIRSNINLHVKDYSESKYDVDFRSLELTGTFNRRYGIQDMNALSSVFNYHRMEGDYDIEMFTFRLQNIYYLKPRLFVDTFYNFTGDNSFDRSFKRHELELKLNHRLFDSLDTSILMGGRLENTLNRDVNALKNNFSFYYRKRFPTGSINLFYSNTNEWSKYTSNQSIASESREFDFSYTDVVIMNQPGINIDSIRVTDPGFSRIYVKDVDYQVEILNYVVVITRLPGGAIPGDGKIVVFYEYLDYPDFRLKLHFYHINFRLNFLKYFNLIYRRRSINNRVESMYVIPMFEDYTDDVLGAQINSKYLTADYMLEKYDSNLSSYKSYNFRINAHIRLFSWLILRGGLTRNRLDFENMDFYTRFRAYTAECTFNPWNRINSNIIFRKIGYSTPIYFRDRESILFKFQWSFRRIIIDIFYERILSETNSYDRGHHFFSVVIRRLF
ncbi:MAG: hypothetical protein JSV88_29005 [Candidatus Aminicenantes bacterium]|nr:MAG: hypothetical protein JSV88_29005 [Candidatus Aminicenantes bacterium]